MNNIKNAVMRRIYMEFLKRKAAGFVHSPLALAAAFALLLVANVSVPHVFRNMPRDSVQDLLHFLQAALAGTKPVTKVSIVGALLSLAASAWMIGKHAEYGSFSQARI